MHACMHVKSVAVVIQESWNPMWTVASILTGLLSFMLEDQITTGSLQSTVKLPVDSMYPEKEQERELIIGSSRFGSRTSSWT